MVVTKETPHPNGFDPYGGQDPYDLRSTTRSWPFWLDDEEKAIHRKTSDCGPWYSGSGDADSSGVRQLIDEDEEWSLCEECCAGFEV